MADTDRPALAALDVAWEAIRKRDDRIPEVEFSLQPRRPSWCNTIEWDTPTIPVLVVNLMDGKRRLSGTELMAWLLHMAAHSVPGGTSPSAEGRFHTLAFRDAAENIGLRAERGLSTGQGRSALGYSRISLENPAPYRSVIGTLDKALAAWFAAIPKDEETGLPLIIRQESRGPVSLACKCTPETLPATDRHTSWPRIIRASVGIARAGRVRCEYCGELFEIREAPKRRTGSSIASYSPGSGRDCGSSDLRLGRDADPLAHRGSATSARTRTPHL
jgi:hypothetical protein